MIRRSRTRITGLAAVLFALALVLPARSNMVVAPWGGGVAVGTLDEVFVGPFPNWINANTGIRVDGTGGSVCTALDNTGATDVSAALQTCMYALTTASPKLWFPAGTYKISDISTTATATLHAQTITVASGTGIKAGMLIRVGTGDTSIMPGTVVADTYTPGSTTVPTNLLVAGTITAGTPIYFSPGVWKKQYIGLVGHDAADTTILWNGSSGGTMLGIVGTDNSQFSRLTFNGNNTATVIVEQTYDDSNGADVLSPPDHTPIGNFDTWNQYTDNVFKNSGIGISCGYYAGCSEVNLIRNTFSNVSRVGIMWGNSNALNGLVWYSTFENCYQGLANYNVTTAHNGAGNFHAYYNKFLNSTFADLLQGNTGAFTFRGNYSSGSNRFTSSGGTSGVDPVTFIGNTVLDTTGASNISIYQNDAGPVVLLDNIIARGTGIGTGPLVQVGNPGSGLGNSFSMGNIYTATSPVLTENHAHAFADQIVARSAVTATAPTLPGTPPNTGPGGTNVSTIFEVPASSSAATIQTAINNAVAAGSRSVVHLQGGNYTVSSTLSTPANSDIQIIGDGHSTSLSCNSSAAPCLKLNGPSKVVLRDFRLTSSVGDGIEINTADQVGARVFMDQVLAGGPITGNAVFYDTLDRTLVEIHNFASVNNTGTGSVVLKAIGGASAQAGSWLGGALNVFQGVMTVNYHNVDISGGAHVLTEAIFYGGENPQPNAVAATGTGPSSGAFTIAGTQLLLSNDTTPVISLTDWRGKSAIVNVIIGGFGTPPAGTEAITGTGTGALNLGLGMAGLTPPFFSDTSTGATFEFLNGINNSDVPPTDLTETAADQTFLGSALSQLRTASASPPMARPAGITDVRVHHVTVEQATNGFHVKN